MVWIIHASHIHGIRPGKPAGKKFPKFGRTSISTKSQSNCLPEEALYKNSKSISEREREAKLKLRQRADQAEAERRNLPTVNEDKKQNIANKNCKKNRSEAENLVRLSLLEVGLLSDEATRKKKRKKEKEKKKKRSQKHKIQKKPSINAKHSSKPTVSSSERSQRNDKTPLVTGGAKFQASQGAQKTRSAAKILGISESELDRKLRALKLYHSKNN